MNALPPVKMPSGPRSPLVRGLAAAEAGGGERKGDGFLLQLAQRIELMRQNGLENGQAGSNRLWPSPVAAAAEASPQSPESIQNGSLLPVSGNGSPPGPMGESVEFVRLPALDVPVGGTAWATALAETLGELRDSGLDAARLPLNPQTYGEVFVGFSTRQDGVDVGLIAADERIRDSLVTGMALWVRALEERGESVRSIVVGGLSPPTDQLTPAMRQAMAGVASSHGEGAVRAFRSESLLWVAAEGTGSIAADFSARSESIPWSREWVRELAARIEPRLADGGSFEWAPEASVAGDWQLRVDRTEAAATLTLTTAVPELREHLQALMPMLAKELQAVDPPLALAFRVQGAGEIQAGAGLNPALVQPVLDAGLPVRPLMAGETQKGNAAAVDAESWVNASGKSAPEVDFSSRSESMPWSPEWVRELAARIESRLADGGSFEWAPETSVTDDWQLRVDRSEAGATLTLTTAVPELRERLQAMLPMLGEELQAYDPSRALAFRVQVAGAIAADSGIDSVPVLATQVHLDDPSWGRVLGDLLSTLLAGERPAAGILADLDGERLLRVDTALDSRPLSVAVVRPEVRDAVLDALPALRERWGAQGLPMETVIVSLVSRGELNGGWNAGLNSLGSPVAKPAAAPGSLAAFLDAASALGSRGLLASDGVVPAAIPGLGSWESLMGTGISEALSLRSGYRPQIFGDLADSLGSREGNSRGSSDLSGGLAALANGSATGASALSQPATPQVARMLALDIPFQQRGWDQVLGQRIQWLVRENVQEARLRLNPRELGVVDIRIQVDGDRAHLQFASAQPNVREALDAALPRLREMFAEGGITLGEVSIGRENPGGNGTSRDQGFDGDSGTDESEQGGNDPNVRSTAMGQSLLDLYA